MQRRYIQCITLSLAIIMCITQAAGASLALAGTLPVPPLPPEMQSQPVTQADTSATDGPVVQTQPYTVLGVVQDSEGRPVGDATVAITSLGLSSKTGSDGYYQISGISFVTGTTYTVSASKSGFSQADGQFIVNGGHSQVDMAMHALKIPPQPPALPGKPSDIITIPTASPTPVPAAQQQPTPSTNAISINQHNGQQSATPVPALATAIITQIPEIAAEFTPQGSSQTNESGIMIHESQVTATPGNTTPAIQSATARPSIVSMAGGLISKLLTLLRG